MEILAKTREITGKKVKKLRKQSIIPAVIFSTKNSQNNKKNKEIQLDRNDFIHVYSEAGETGIININLDKKNNINTLITDVQKHPVTLEPIHVSFFEVDMAKKVTANVPIVLINTDTNEAVKAGIGSITQLLREVEVECLPNEIPHQYEVDTSVLQEINQNIVLEDAIKINKSKVTLITPIDEIVAKLSPLQEEIEEEVEEEPITEEGVGTEEGTVKDEENPDKNTEDNENNEA